MVQTHVKHGTHESEIKHFKLNILKILINNEQDHISRPYIAEQLDII